MGGGYRINGRKEKERRNKSTGKGRIN